MQAVPAGAFGAGANYFRPVSARVSATVPTTAAKCLLTDRRDGNAAQTLHPTAGQGFNLGLRDVMSPAENAGRGTGRGRGYWRRHVLSRYQQRRQAGPMYTIGTLNGLVHLFG